MWENCFFNQGFECANKITLTGKERGELIKLFYLNGESDSETVRVYKQNNKLRRGPCSVRTVCDLVKTIWETVCTYDRPRSLWPVEVPFEVVAEVHNTITASPMRTARNVARNLNARKISPEATAFCSVGGCCLIDSRASRCCNLQTSNSVYTLRIYSSSDIMKIADGRWMRHIVP